MSQYVVPNCCQSNSSDILLYNETVDTIRCFAVKKWFMPCFKSAHTYTYPYTYLGIYLPIYLSIHLPIYLLDVLKEFSDVNFQEDSSPFCFNLPPMFMHFKIKWANSFPANLIKFSSRKCTHKTFQIPKRKDKNKEMG